MQKDEENPAVPSWVGPGVAMDLAGCDGLQHEPELHDVIQAGGERGDCTVPCDCGWAELSCLGSTYR